MRITVAMAVFISLLVAAVPSVRGEVQIDPLRTSPDSGWTAAWAISRAQDGQDQFVVSSDESPISLLTFLGLKRPRAVCSKVEKKGAPQVEFDLTAGNRVRLTGRRRVRLHDLCPQGTGQLRRVSF